MRRILLASESSVSEEAETNQVLQRIIPGLEPDNTFELFTLVLAENKMN
jgi:hypothetical protein